MDHKEQIHLIERLMSHIDNDTTDCADRQVKNPASSYLSPELAEREWESFFQSYPQIIGLSADLPEPESFLTSDDLGKPILCTRGRDGVFRAFLNVCRHRSSLVEKEAMGCKKRFTCPFHGWAYDHDGSLVGIRKEEQFGGIDRASRGLVELPAAERHGLLFVSPDPNGSLDVDAALGDLGPELASWRIEELERDEYGRYDLTMNWKLAVDTFGEPYHFDILHRDTLAQYFYGNVQTYDGYGLNHRLVFAQHEMDNLRNKPQKEWQILHGCTTIYYLFPNVQLIFERGGPTVARLYPDGTNPHRSFARVSFYRNEEGRLPEFAEAMAMRAEATSGVFENEDFVAAADAYRGILSGASDHLLFGRNEPALQHFHHAFREVLDMPPLETIDQP